MKKVLFTIAFLCSFWSLQPLLAQTYTVHFDYDVAGNRTNRWVDVSKLKETDSIPPELAKPNNEVFAQTFVYPNPTFGSLTIEMEIDAEQPATYLLTDTQGKALASAPITDNKTTLHLEADKPGIYFLQLTNKRGSAIYKIIKH